jgi:hypothetical protein
MKTRHFFTLAGFGLMLFIPSTAAFAEQVGITTSKETLAKTYGGKVYSPYAQRSFPTFPLWGETHLHTGYSMDAGLFGNRTLHDTGYRFARGEEVMASSGQRVKLARPLDWLVIADHSDQMGMVQDILKGDPVVMGTEQGKRWNAGISGGGSEQAQATALNLIETFAQGELDPKLVEAYSPGSPKYQTIWDKIIKTAEEYNEPGHFTTLIGFEWTSLVKGGNMHRNVIFRDGADKAGQVVPYVTQKPLGSTDPLDLYKWMDEYEKKTGGSVLAIAHNGNLSNGIMFPVDAQYTGRKIDKKYVEARAKREPLYEVTQIKGDGEAHPFLSPDDQFADYETWDEGALDLLTAKTNDMLQYEYAREALKNGLVLEEKLGTNPYKFGMVGATDSHTSLATVEEENFFGKHTGYEPSPERLTHPFQKTDVGVRYSWQMAAAGLQAVFSTENTREAIYDAMERKETYATTGPRMMVRFFGGWDFTKDDINSRQPAFRGYEKGVPMGGDLKPVKDKKAPTFMVYALRDPIGANLDRIQIIKGWTDKNGKTHEKVYDIAVSDGRTIGSNGRCDTPVGNTVDIKNANWTNTIGASELATVWTDPDFDAGQRAFYYARVLEIPTPRWVVYDAHRYGIEIPEGATTIGQERAYTSPIWYTPES